MMMIVDRQVQQTTEKVHGDVVTKILVQTDFYDTVDFVTMGPDCFIKIWNIEFVLEK